MVGLAMSIALAIVMVYAGLFVVSLLATLLALPFAIRRDQQKRG